MKAILVDDEPLALDFLEHQLNKLGNIDVIGKFVNLDIRNRSPLLEEADVVFLDIEMPEINGLELAEQLLEFDSSLSIVFVTAFNEYAIQAFDLNAVDYVLKPIQLDRLQRTLERVEMNATKQQSKPVTTNNYLQINVCRELTFELAKGKFYNIQWRTAKAQEVFLYLLHNIGKTIRKAELIELIWPIEQNRTYSQLYTAIYHIRKALDQFGNHFTLKNVQHGYTLFVENVFIDILEWENSVKTAPPIHTETIEYYETMMVMYTGPYLEVYDYVWAETERYRLEQLWINTAYKMAGFYLKQRNMEMMEAWYVKISDLRPEEEDAHFYLMKLYAELGYGLLVNHQYARLNDALQELGLEMSAPIKSWYEQWTRNKSLSKK